jgi:rubredoxin
MPKTEVFASIMVQKRIKKLFGIIPLLPLYDISYTEDFDPNGRTKKYFARGILSINLEEQVRRVVLKYNQAVAENSIQHLNLGLPVKETPVQVNVQVHQCKICFTVYDPAYGDELNNVPPGVPFDKLPDDYCCPVCESPKEIFKPIINLPSHEKN